MKVYRCWWCSGNLPEGTKGKDCGRSQCIERRRSGAWRKRKKKVEK